MTLGMDMLLTISVNIVIFGMTFYHIDHNDMQVLRSSGTTQHDDSSSHMTAAKNGKQGLGLGMQEGIADSAALV